jgi:hypothetical protein
MDDRPPPRAHEHRNRRATSGPRRALQRTIGALIVMPVTLTLLALAGCGGGTAVTGVASQAAATTPATSVAAARPQAIEPTAGVQAGVAVTPQDPVGDPSAHPRSLTEVRRELRLEVIAAPINSANYIDPLRYVTVWGRTDQGVDATMPVDAPIIAPSRIKILAIIPDWYAGQPLVYFEMLDGPKAGRVQYVAEQITHIAAPGSILQQGQTIATYAASGTGIEYGWSTVNGVTLARATTGYEEGQATPAGRSIRGWLNGLGANAGQG